MNKFKKEGICCEEDISTIAYKKEKNPRLSCEKEYKRWTEGSEKQKEKGKKKTDCLIDEKR
ncbi:MAG: hypothetical protein PWQ20_1400 [Thermotogaceae bacterium]|nr:hypothetical protein [Thermotogaceae bacterium]MDN5338330.1 hypothetical protein [Thermotogaceae bacterium]